jgi:hypothetical protein
MPSQNSFPDFTSNSIPSPSHKKSWGPEVGLSSRRELIICASTRRSMSMLAETATSSVANFTSRLLLADGTVTGPKFELPKTEVKKG